MVLAATEFKCIQTEVAVNRVLVASIDCLLSLQCVKGKQCKVAKENLHSNFEINENSWLLLINLDGLVS